MLLVRSTTLPTVILGEAAKLIPVLIILAILNSFCPLRRLLYHNFQFLHYLLEL